MFIILISYNVTFMIENILFWIFDFWVLIADRIKALNKDIKYYFHQKKSKSVRRRIVPGNSASLWDAVKTAKDVNSSDLRNTMYIRKTPISREFLPETFAGFFNDKIVSLSCSVVINDGVYNRVKKVNTENKMFMDRNSIKECIMSLKMKNTEGYDRIPQRILVDGVDLLLESFVGLFSRIYNQT